VVNVLFLCILVFGAVAVASVGDVIILFAVVLEVVAVATVITGVFLCA